MSRGEVVARWGSRTAHPSGRRAVGAVEGVIALILFVLFLVLVWHFWGDISALLRAVGL